MARCKLHFLLERMNTHEFPSWASEGVTEASALLEGHASVSLPITRVNRGAESQGQGTDCPFTVPPRKAHKVQPLYPHTVHTCV